LKKEIALMEVKMRRLFELLDEVSSSLLHVCILLSFLMKWYISHSYNAVNPSTHFVIV